MLVRTGGRYAGARGGGDSWLLIKHRDDWAGDLDITEFAPKSVKSDGDFEDILAEDTPAVWTSNRPAKGGEAGAMLAKIIERAAKLNIKEKSGAKGKGGTKRKEKLKNINVINRGSPRVGGSVPQIFCSFPLFPPPPFYNPIFCGGAVCGRRAAGPGPPPRGNRAERKEVG